MDYIQRVEKTYNKVSKCIQYQKNELLSDIPGPSAIPSQIEKHC